MVKRLNRTIGKCMPLLAAVATALILGSCASEEKGAEAFLLKYNNDSLVARLGVGLWGTGIPADRNNDGLTDLVVTSCGRPYRGTYLYYNIGTNDKPLFDKAVKISDTAYQCTHISTVGGKDYVFAKDSYYPDFTNGSYANPQIIKYEGEEIGKGVKKNRTTVCSFIGMKTETSMSSTARILGMITGGTMHTMNREIGRTVLSSAKYIIWRTKIRYITTGAD